jgi:hypothetical protein
MAEAKFDEETAPSVFKTNCRLSQSPHLRLILVGVDTIVLYCVTASNAAEPWYTCLRHFAQLRAEIGISR